MNKATSFLSSKRKYWGIAVLVLAVWTGSVHAIIPAIPVVDAASILKIIDETTQIKHIVQQTTQSYQLAKQMTQVFTKMPSYYKSLLTSQISQLQPSLACANCGTWATAANMGGFAGGDATYGGVVGKLPDVGRIMSPMDPTAQQRFQTVLAHSYYLRQASIDQDLAALGKARSNDQNMQEYVQQCQNSVMDQSLVTDVQIAQAGNACTTVIAQGQTTTNAMLARIVENHSIETARQMDEEARRVDQLGDMQAAAQAWATTPEDGMDEIIANWKLQQ